MVCVVLSVMFILVISGVMVVCRVLVLVVFRWSWVGLSIIRWLWVVWMWIGCR